MTSGRCSFAAATAATPSPTEATISTSSLIPSRSSRASRKTSLSSTSTIRTGGIRPTLFRSEQKGIVRLAAFVHLEVEPRMSRLESFDEPVERRRLGAGEKGQDGDRQLCLLGGVLGGKPHVRVVRQEDRLFRLDLLERRNELRSRRVRGLPAGDDADRPDRLGERLEQPPVPLPRDDCDDSAL